MDRHSHQSSVIGPDLCCDWLIILICNHYCTEKQLRLKKERKKKRIRQINVVKSDTCGAVLSPYRLHTAPRAMQVEPHTPEDGYTVRRPEFHRRLCFENK